MQGLLAGGASINSTPAEQKVDSLLDRSRALTKEQKLKEAVDAAIDTVMMKLDDEPGVGR